MKSYEEMTDNVLKRRDEYMKERARQAKIARGISLTAVCLCLASVITIGGWTVVNRKSEGGFGDISNLPPVHETNGDTSNETDDNDAHDTSKTPTAAPVIDTTPGHDVEKLPIEIPDDSAVIHIPSGSGVVGDINIPITTESLYENADLVIIGEFLGTDSTFATETMQFISQGKVRVKEVRKGEAQTDAPLDISFYGGTVPVALLVNQVPQERLAKYGWLDMTKDEQERFLITYSSSLSSADLKAGETYLFFLGENEYGNFVMCDAYGARKINSDGKAYNPETRLYEEIPVLHQYTSLDEAKNNETYGECLPDFIPEGFYVESLRYFKNGDNEYLRGLWSRGYDDISWRVSDADEYSDSRRTSTSNTVNYDLALYPIPRAESVPEELREIVDDPVFDAKEVTLEIIYRRAYKVDDACDTDGYRINFSIQIDGTVISLRTKGVTPEELYAMLRGIIE